MTTEATYITRVVRQAIGTIGLGIGIGVGGTFPSAEEKNTLLLAILGIGLGAHLIFSTGLPGRHRVTEGWMSIGLGAGIGIGGTFPDGSETYTWLLGAILCLIGSVILVRRKE